VQHEQTVATMVEEVLTRQAKFRVEQSGESFEQVFKAIVETEAGGQLRQLGTGPTATRRPTNGRRSSPGSASRYN
jgi:hypothetical protein